MSEDMGIDIRISTGTEYNISEHNYKITFILSV